MRCAQVGLPMTEPMVEVEVWVRHKGATICVLREQAGGVDALEDWLEGFADYRDESFKASLFAICERLDGVAGRKIPYLAELKDFKSPSLFEIKRGSFRLLCHYKGGRIVVVHWDRKRGSKLPPQVLRTAHRRARMVEQASTDRRLKQIEFEN